MSALILSFLGRFAPWIAGGVLILGVALYGWHLHASLHRAEASLRTDRGTISQLETVNAQNRVELKRLAATAAAWQTALTAAETTDARAGRVSERIMTTIARAPTHEDGPVAPVLARTLAAIASAQGGGKSRASEGLRYCRPCCWPAAAPARPE